MGHQANQKGRRMLAGGLFNVTRPGVAWWRSPHTMIPLDSPRDTEMPSFHGSECDCRMVGDTPARMKTDISFKTLPGGAAAANQSRCIFPGNGFVIFAYEKSTASTMPGEMF